MTTPPSRPRRRQLSVDAYVEGVRAGDRSILGRAITLIESTHPRHQRQAEAVLTALMPFTGHAHRIGVTGVPGVGKSTFIDTFGSNLTALGHRVAVLAVDPSSSRSGGSILGDKTRMARLSVDPRAFVRPSPTSGTLGGVASKTRETMLVCEAAGFDVVLVETVGVGQSELVVAEMTDFFLVLMLAGAGDELQGIKRGLMEVADMLVVNKADGDNARRARRAASVYRGALNLLQPRDAAWTPKVATCSALENLGLDEIWTGICEHREVLHASGAWHAKRQRQQLQWLWTLVEEGLRRQLHNHPAVKKEVPAVEAAVVEGTLAPTAAATKILQAFASGDVPAGPFK